MNKVQMENILTKESAPVCCQVYPIYQLWPGSVSNIVWSCGPHALPWELCGDSVSCWLRPLVTSHISHLTSSSSHLDTSHTRIKEQSKQHTQYAPGTEEKEGKEEKEEKEGTVDSTGNRTVRRERGERIEFILIMLRLSLELEMFVIYYICLLYISNLSVARLVSRRRPAHYPPSHWWAVSRVTPVPALPLVTCVRTEVRSVDTGSVDTAAHSQSRATACAGLHYGNQHTAEALQGTATDLSSLIGIGIIGTNKLYFYCSNHMLWVWIKYNQQCMCAAPVFFRIYLFLKSHRLFKICI